MMVALYLTGISNVLSGKAVSESSMCYDGIKDLKNFYIKTVYEATFFISEWKYWPTGPYIDQLESVAWMYQGKYRVPALLYVPSRWIHRQRSLYSPKDRELWSSCQGFKIGQEQRQIQDSIRIIYIPVFHPISFIRMRMDGGMKRGIWCMRDRIVHFLWSQKDRNG